jgi:tetratricopeptide (TPR) repeat protein
VASAFYLNLGLAHYQLGQKAQAEARLPRVNRSHQRGFAPSQFVLGMILFKKQDFLQAERLIQNELAMEPGSALGKYFLGQVQFRSESPRGSRKERS